MLASLYIAGPRLTALNVVEALSAKRDREYRTSLTAFSERAVPISTVAAIESRERSRDT